MLRSAISKHGKDLSRVKEAVKTRPVPEVVHYYFVECAAGPSAP